MDILGFPLIRRLYNNETRKSADLQQCLIHEPGGSSRVATYSSGHKRRSTGTAAPTRTRARARVNLSTTDASCTSKLYRFIPYGITRL